MTDRSTKILLAVIAAGLWANVVALQVRPATADASLLRSIDNHLANLTIGTCINRKLC